MSSLLSIRVTPGARHELLEYRADGSWKITLRAQPVEGEANKALCKKLAELLKISQLKIAVIRGEKSRQKIVKVTDLSQEEVTHRLLSYTISKK